MSFFVLVRDGATRAALEGLLAALAPQFRSPLELHVGAARLLLFGNQSSDPPAFHGADNGDFIAALGSIIYKGEPAPACLPGLLEDFDPETFDWRGLIGTHVILVFKRGRLHLVGDGLGAAKIYRNRDQTLWSNSFLAMLELGSPRRFDVQACYEYVCNGSVFGTRTLVEGIEALSANTMLVIDHAVRQIRLASPIRNDPGPAGGSLDGFADAHVRQLDDVFGPIAACHRDRLRVSFSGGFDSRLMLAMLLRHDARPTLFVYGDTDDADVQIARTIGKAEGLELVHIDKGAEPAVDPDAFEESVRHDLVAFDGWKVEHDLFDFGVDGRDRVARHAYGQVPLNGSLGEIYRNFFYMPDRRSSTGAVVSTFYSRYDPRAFTGRFDEGAYRAAMQAAMREAIGADSDELERYQVEEIYPKFRGRFWTGRDAQINQRFGPMFFPYLEHAAISNTARVPLRHKDLGYLQGRMIARVNPRLAAYPSDYGFPLDGARPLKYRLKTFLGTQRPAVLRKSSFRLTHRRMESRDGPLSPEYLSRVIDLEFPVMRALFDLGAVHSATQYGLIATLEYLGERYDLAVPEK